jgi:TetR/AcrR family acrAB operon transcriptional repressor
MNSRERILDAAMEVFAQFGYRRASMDQVAGAAGLTRQAVYHHFKSKRDLFRAAVEAFHAQSHAVAVAAGLKGEAAGASLAEIIADQIDARMRYVLECLEEASQPAELLSERQSQARDLIQSFTEQSARLYIETIERVCQARQLVLREDMTAADLARYVQIAVSGFDDLKFKPNFLDELKRVVRLIVMGAVVSAPSRPVRPAKKISARKKSKPRT